MTPLQHKLTSVTTLTLLLTSYTCARYTDIPHRQPDSKDPHSGFPQELGFPLPESKAYADTDDVGLDVYPETANDVTGYERLEVNPPDKRKRTCRLGLNSARCRMSELHKAMGQLNYLQGANSPGKRSGGVDPPSKRKRTCRLGMNSSRCRLAELHSAVGELSYLRGAGSPGKRAGILRGKHYRRSFGDVYRYLANLR